MKFLITAGPTKEFIDPVRYITNRSSGKMGLALVKAALKLGHDVTLITSLKTDIIDKKVKVIPIISALDMLKCVKEEFENSNVLIMAAAVCDYSPVNYSFEKIKKIKEKINLELIKTPDILKEISKNKKQQFVVGFSAETNDLLINAKKKLEEKYLDIIVANDITQKGAGFDVDTNIVSILYKDGQIEQVPEMSKIKLGELLIDIIIKRIK